MRQGVRRRIAVGLAVVGMSGLAIPAGALTLNETQKLLAKDSGPGVNFGISVAVSDDTAVIGAIRERAAYVFTRVEGTWVQQAKLVPSVSISEDFFGFSVAVSGDTVVVGAPYDDSITLGAGSAYVFKRDKSGTWNEQARLIADDFETQDFFGDSVAVSGKTVVIGAWGDDNDRGSNAGAAYVFTGNGNGVWTQQAKLMASDGTTSWNFGQSVAVQAKTIVVGADGARPAGAAYVFTNGRGKWSEQAKLVPKSATRFSLFGVSIALDGNKILVGAPSDVGNTQESGAAYVFSRNAPGTWDQEVKLVAPDGAPRDLFGLRVALSGERAVIGVPGDDDLGEDSGSAYAYIRENSGRWANWAKLLASDGAAGDDFGAVAVAGQTAIVGAPRHDTPAENSGSAYVFSLHPSSEQRLAALLSEVHALVDEGKLPRGLLAPLEAAEVSLAQGNSRPAINQIKAFIRQVEATVRSRRIPERRGAELITAAEQVIRSIEGE